MAVIPRPGRRARLRRGPGRLRRLPRALGRPGGRRARRGLAGRGRQGRASTLSRRRRARGPGRGRPGGLEREVRRRRRGPLGSRRRLLEGTCCLGRRERVFAATSVQQTDLCRNVGDSDRLSTSALVSDISRTSRAPPAPRDLFRPETSIGVAPEPPLPPRHKFESGGAVDVASRQKDRPRAREPCPRRAGARGLVARPWRGGRARAARPRLSGGVRGPASRFLAKASPTRTAFVAPPPEPPEPRPAPRATRSRP